MMISWVQAALYSFCFAAFIQIAYYLYFFLRIALYKAPQVSNAQAQPVSIIICARNEAANLAKNLTGTLTQKFSAAHEVIVVDDNSSDESKYILERYAKEYRQLRVIGAKRTGQQAEGKKFPLSAGIDAARHEIVLLTDADCIPASGSWIRKMQAGYKNNTEIVIGYGAYRKQASVLNKVIRWETFHSALQYLSYALAGLPYMGVGRNLSYKKSIFMRQKGFSSHINIPGGDDDLFINAAANSDNTAVVIDKDAFTISGAAQTWKEWRRQKSRHFSTGRYYKSATKILLGLYALTHFLFYPLFVLCLIKCNAAPALVVFLARLIMQAFVFYRSMKILNERDLFVWFVFLDIWMFFYYTLFSFSIIKRPSRSWK